MKLSEKKSGNFTPCPEFNGRAVCVDVTPPETKQTEYGPKEKFRVVFETDQANPEREGERHCVWSSGFTTSLNEKSAFRKFLRQWFGRDLTAQELEEFDTETLIGKPAFVVVTHSQGDNGETYANITACTPHKQGEPLQPTGKFTRKKDREQKPANGAGGSGGASAAYRKAEQPKNPEGESVGRDNWMRTKVHVGKHAGVDLGDLDTEAVEKLLKNWLPVFKTMPKPLVADKRLAEALGFAEAAMKEAVATPPPPPPAPAPEY